MAYIHAQTVQNILWIPGSLGMISPQTLASYDAKFCLADYDTSQAKMPKTLGQGGIGTNCNNAPRLRRNLRRLPHAYRPDTVI